jgi:hypothetical protein
MTHVVTATFPDGEAARSAALALGRTELAAGPTRVQVGASGASNGARLELRVEDRDAPRAIALLREHGAQVSERTDADDLRSGDGALSGWGMAIADAVTSAMAGVDASDAQLPATSGPRRSDDSATAGGATGPNLDATGPGAPGTMRQTPAGGTDATGIASGSRSRAEPGPLEQSGDRSARDAVPRGRRPRSDA